MPSVRKDVPLHNPSQTSSLNSLLKANHQKDLSVPTETPTQVSEIEKFSSMMMLWFRLKESEKEGSKHNTLFATYRRLGAFNYQKSSS